jgi:hypothetical protein
VDLDTVLLRDWAPLLQPSLTPWAARSGVGMAMDSALMRLSQQPDELTSRVLIGTILVRTAAGRMSVRPSAPTVRSAATVIVLVASRPLPQSHDSSNGKLNDLVGFEAISTQRFRLLPGVLYDLVGIRREDPLHYQDSR